MTQTDLIIKQQEQLLRGQKTIETKLDAVLVLLTVVVKQEDDVMQELDDIKADVQKTTDVEESAVVLIKGLAAKIDASAADPVALRALSAQLRAKATELAEAVAANTPAEPAA